MRRIQGSERVVSFKGVVGLGGGRAAVSGVLAPLLTASVHGLLVQWGGVPMKGVVAIPSVVGVSIPIENMIENV